MGEAVAECEESENGEVLLGGKGEVIGGEPVVEYQERNEHDEVWKITWDEIRKGKLVRIHCDLQGSKNVCSLCRQPHCPESSSLGFFSVSFDGLGINDPDGKSPSFRNRLQ